MVFRSIDFRDGSGHFEEHDLEGFGRGHALVVLLHLGENRDEGLHLGERIGGDAFSEEGDKVEGVVSVSDVFDEGEGLFTALLVVVFDLFGVCGDLLGDPFDELGHFVDFFSDGFDFAVGSFAFDFLEVFLEVECFDNVLDVFGFQANVFSEFADLGGDIGFETLQENENIVNDVSCFHLDEHEALLFHL